MEYIFNPKNKKQYVQGYTFGLFPVFHDCEDMLKIAPHFNNEAFIIGFHEGRFEYEKLNGKVCEGIPEKIITEKVLADFFLEGKLGMPCNTDGYTPHQTIIIRQYYQSGYSYFSPDFDMPLLEVLADNGIEF
jgi:hypothetical protein